MARAASAEPAEADGQAGLPAAGSVPWRFRRRRRSDLGRWPFRVGICAALAVLTGLAALEQRGALAPPRWGVILLVALAVLPWLVDLLIAVPPPWAFAPAVLVPVAILHDPTRLDPLPFLVAVLALDMGLQLGAARSAPIVLGGAAVVLWQIGVVPAGPTRPVQGLVASIGAGWLIGLALHSQVRRVARLRRERDVLVERVAAAELSGPHGASDARLRGRLEQLVAELAGMREDAQRGPVAGAPERLARAEQHARELLADLDGRALGGSER